MRWSTLPVAIALVTLGSSTVQAYGALGRYINWHSLMQSLNLFPPLISTLSLFFGLQNTTGHTITGQIAQQFLTTTTASQISQILDPKYDGLLGNVAPWADTVRWMSSFK